MTNVSIFIYCEILKWALMYLRSVYVMIHRLLVLVWLRNGRRGTFYAFSINCWLIFRHEPMSGITIVLVFTEQLLSDMLFWRLLFNAYIIVFFFSNSSSLNLIKVAFFCFLENTIIIETIMGLRKNSDKQHDN